MLWPSSHERGEQTKKEPKINRVDPESVLVKGPQGTHCGYNMQNVVDDKNGLIVHTDVVSESNDLKQLATQISGAEAALGCECEVACGDAGYWDITEIEKLESVGKKVVVPSKTQASGKEIGPFEKSRFTYDADSDCYLCPEGHRLIFKRFKEKKSKENIALKNEVIVGLARILAACTKSKRGRTVTRHVLEELSGSSIQKI